MAEQRDERLASLMKTMLGEISADLGETKQSVASVRRRNVELEKFAEQVGYENSVLKEKLNQALARLDERDHLQRKRDAEMATQVEEARQAAVGEIDRALGSYRELAGANAQIEERCLRAESLCGELEQRAVNSEQSSSLLQYQLVEANQLTASLARRLEESERYARTLESSLAEITSSRAGSW